MTEPASSEHSDGLALAGRLRGHVEMLAAIIGPRNLSHPSAYEAAEAYISQQLTAAGFDVKRIPYRCGGQEVANLEARLDPPGARGAPIVVGAHYDTCGDTPGADDNASAVAVLLEMARLIRRDAKVAPPTRPLRFVAFANEEPPHFRTQTMGSLVYAGDCRERGETLEGMVCLEMVGYFLTGQGSQPYPDDVPAALRATLPSRGDFLVLISDTASSRFTYRLRRKMGMRSRLDPALPKVPFLAFGLPPGLTGGGHMLSDHWSFRQVGYSATMVTDTAFVRNPHYHMPTDTPDTLDYERMAQGVLRLVRAVSRY